MSIDLPGDDLDHRRAFANTDVDVAPPWPLGWLGRTTR